MAGISISGAVGNIGGAVSELFAADASRAKADMFRTSARMDLLKGRGAQIEGENYSKAYDLAELNRRFTEASTEVQTTQADRASYMALGGIRAGYGASGLAQSGSAEDVLAASARQGALEHQVLAQQGVITEAGYEEQRETYAGMVNASEVAVEASKEAAAGHMRAADAEEHAATGHEIGAAIKGIGAVASLFGV